MERVIRRKQDWWPDIQDYTVDARSQFVWTNDSMAVAAGNRETTIYWSKTQGFRVMTRAGTGPTSLGQLLGLDVPESPVFQNLYQDNVDVFGNRLIGVTHPSALRHYVFTLDTTKVVDGERVFRLRVEPKNVLASTFRGTVTVVDSVYALRKVRLQPASSLSTSRVVKGVSVTFRQNFVNVGGRFWMPIDFRKALNLDVQVSALLSYSDIRLHQETCLSGYAINVSSGVHTGDSVHSGRERARPQGHSFDFDRALPTDSERHCCDSPDQTIRPGSTTYSRDLIERAFKQGGLLGWFQDVAGVFPVGLPGTERSGVGGASDSVPSDSTEVGSNADPLINLKMFRPVLRYNRVEQAHIGGRVRVEEGPIRGIARGGHNTGPSTRFRWSYGGAFRWMVPGDRTVELSYHYGVEARHRARSRMAPLWAEVSNSIWTLAGAPDYYDYFGNERFRFSVEQAVSVPDLTARVQLRNERHFSVEKTSDYNILGRAVVQPPNPSIQEGWVRSIALLGTWGKEGLLGVTPVNRVQLSIEHSNSELFRSDFNFTVVELLADVRLETLLKRRYLPNTLDVRLDAGVSLQTPPLQRFGVIEASPQPYTPFGALRTLDDRPYQGKHHVGLFWEHNFRGILFELIGWRGPVERDIELILHGGHGRTWIGHDAPPGVQIRATKGFHHEIGFSINGLLYDTLRLDITKPLTASGISMGVSFIRFR